MNKSWGAGTWTGAGARWAAPLVGVAVVLASCGGDGSTTGTGGSTADTGGAPATTATSAAPVEKAKPAAGTGNVQGKVLYDDKPAAGVEAKLCETFSRFGSGCSGAEHKAQTEADGTFVIANVPPKEYQALLVRVFDTDLFVFAQSGFVAAKTYTVEPDKTLFVDTTHLYKSDLQVKEPASGASVGGAGVVVRWDAYAGAAYYKLSLQPDGVSVSSPVSNQRVDSTSYTVPSSLPSGKYRVKLEAFNGKDRKLAEGPDGYTFTVTA
jgi:hypothetical protein